MKILLPFLVAITALAQSPPAAPQNLRLASTTTTDIIPLPVVATNGLFMAVWYSPPYVLRTNAVYQPDSFIWLPEYSTDGVTWNPAPDLIYLPPRAVRSPPQPCTTCLHFTQTASASDQLRIRRMPY